VNRRTHTGTAVNRHTHERTELNGIPRHEELKLRTQAPGLRIGDTPLVRLETFETKPGVEIHAKLEFHNAGGSVKDRAALAMVEDGERRGLLGAGQVLLDATSGNTGISYAMLGAARGFLVKLCVPANVTRERRQMLQSYGADLVLTDPMDGTDGAIEEARRIYAADPARYFYPDQYSNDANWRAHYDTTGPEILEQTGGQLTHFVAGLGTSGTFIGTGRRLRASGRPIELVAVQPESPLHGLEGLKHMASAIVPRIFDPSLADRNLSVATEDAQAMTRRLVRDAGLFVGPSSGAALSASLEVARGIDRGVIVTIFPDGGGRYLSERFWQAPGEGVRLPVETRAEIRAHGAATYPDECCGVLLGPKDGAVTDTWRLDNSTDLERRRRFLIGPDDYRRAEQRAAERGLDIVGFYHSHPDHPAEPSAFDLAHAWPNLSYAIVSIRGGVPREMRSWRLRADRSGYDEESIT
jgi:S-sulfo-L-cysteine synthase (O-acetyl-L-serine-dependent)